MSKRKLYKCDTNFCWNDCDGQLKECINRNDYVRETRKELLKKRYNKHDPETSKELIKKRLEDINLKSDLSN